MEIRVKRSEFLNELAPMQGIVERRTTIPVLSHILLRGEDDKIHLAATDLDVCWFQTKDGGTDHHAITFNFSKRCRRSRWAAKTTFFGVFWPGSRARLPPRSEWTVPPCQPRVGVGEKCHR